MELRRASRAELGALLELDRACFARPWTAQGWTDELEPAAGEGLVVLAIEDGVALGSASAPCLPTGECELRRIAVRPEHRRRGLGGDLLAAVIAHARERGCPRIWLEVAENNHGALALYRRAGFRQVGRRPGYYRDPPAAALLLELELSRPGGPEQ